jgi:citrate lyase beta subunit
MTAEKKTALSESAIRETLAPLLKANKAFNQNYPGESPNRQPVHTVYGGAHLFKSDSAPKLGEVALRSLKEYAPDSEIFDKILKLGGLSNKIYERVQEKLKSEPIEDFRIDFEDGYGNRPDSEEDHHAEAAALEVAKGIEQKTLPPFIGIRIKPFSQELTRRSVRTLDIFLTALSKKTNRKLPSNFVITIPKVTIPEQVKTLVKLCEKLESKLKLPKKSLKIELMIETPQAILDHHGRSAFPYLIEAAEERCTGAHFGTYDYTASVGITAAYQEMTHPACDFAKHVMQVSLAGTGIWISDGATNVIPAGPHRGGNLTPEQIEENRRVVHRAWKLHYDHVRHSLKHAFYQGWDLHPAHLPTRYAAIYAFFLESLDQASIRLKSFVEKAAQATLVGDVFDDAATGQALLNYFLRGLNCRAITNEEALATGLSLAELRSRSFLKILESRSQR